MNSQGLFGALVQYWNISDKPRLDRKNTYFEDNLQLSNYDALKVGIVVSVATAIVIIFWSLMGVIL